MWYAYTKGEYMTQIIVVFLPPVVIAYIFYFLKYCVNKFARYKELKLLIDSGVEHGEVSKDHVLF